MSRVALPPWTGFWRARIGFRRSGCSPPPLRPRPHPHLGSGRPDGGGRMCTPLQITRPGRARLPLLPAKWLVGEDHRSQNPTAPPSLSRSRESPHLSLYARLLCRVASARGLAGIDVCRRRSGGQRDARSDSPALRSAAAKSKALRHYQEDGTPVHSFHTLLADLATVLRNTCRALMADPDAPSFSAMPTPTPSQERAFALIDSIAA